MRPEGLPSATLPTPALPNQPSIALFPFANRSGDPEQEYFANGSNTEMYSRKSIFKTSFGCFHAAFRATSVLTEL
jgi:TolB-like protein